MNVGPLFDAGYAEGLKAKQQEVEALKKQLDECRRLASEWSSRRATYGDVYEEITVMNSCGEQILEITGYEQK